MAAKDGMTGRSWHEGSVGTIAYFDAEGKRLKSTYLARMPEPNKQTLTGQLAEEMLAVVAERPAMNIVFASDGAVSHWTGLKTMQKRLPGNFTGHVMPIIDFFPVAEYVRVAANAIHGAQTPEAKVLTARHYPIGTGITEAAAKTVVSVRMKRAGARFSQHGGQTIMLFRAATLSKRFDLLHEELYATYKAKIAA